MQSHEFSSSGTMFCTLKVRRMLPIVWCNLSNIAFAWGFLEVIGLTFILQSFIVISLILARSSFYLSTITLLGIGQRPNQATSTWLDTRCVCADGTVCISIHPLDGSIINIVNKHIFLILWSLYICFHLPLVKSGISFLLLQWGCTYRLSHGLVSIFLGGSFQYCFSFLFKISHLVQTSCNVLRKFFQQKC